MGTLPPYTPLTSGAGKRLHWSLVVGQAGGLAMVWSDRPTTDDRRPADDRRPTTDTAASAGRSSAEPDHAARHLALLHCLEGAVHVLEADGAGDELVDLEAFAHVEIDQLHHVAVQVRRAVQRADDALLLERQRETRDGHVLAEARHANHHHLAAALEGQEPLRDH